MKTSRSRELAPTPLSEATYRATVTHNTGGFVGGLLPTVPRDTLLIPISPIKTFSVINTQTVRPRRVKYYAEDSDRAYPILNTTFLPSGDYDLEKSGAYPGVQILQGSRFLRLTQGVQGETDADRQKAPLIESVEQLGRPDFGVLSTLRLLPPGLDRTREKKIQPFGRGSATIVTPLLVGIFPHIQRATLAFVQEGRIIQQASITYDESPRISVRGLSLQLASPSKIVDYSYDAEGRLIKAEYKESQKPAPTTRRRVRDVLREITYTTTHTDEFSNYRQLSSTPRLKLKSADGQEEDGILIWDTTRTYGDGTTTKIDMEKVLHADYTIYLLANLGITQKHQLITTGQEKHIQQHTTLPNGKVITREIPLGEVLGTEGLDFNAILGLGFTAADLKAIGFTKDQLEPYRPHATAMTERLNEEGFEGLKTTYSSIESFLNKQE